MYKERQQPLRRHSSAARDQIVRAGDASSLPEKDMASH